MSSISIETKKINELDKATAAGSDEDLLVIRFADGTGVKSISVAALRKAMNGDLTALQTTDKSTLVAAINEVLGVTGTNAEAITVLNTLTEILTKRGAGLANSIAVEKDLGTSFTAAQSAAIKDGTFKDLFVGGYWTINGTKYWAGHADYRLHCGDSELTQHHMLVFPDKCFYNAQMNTTDTTAGGYNGSAMKTSNLATALAKVKADFGADHVLAHRELLPNAVSNGQSSGWAWYDTQIDLMTEHMVYGSHAWGGGSQNGFDTGINKSQIALFQHRPDLICNRDNWWLRDVQSAAFFAHVSYRGDANDYCASASCGVRPAFLIS
jgi:hypothetical protein